MLDIQIIKKFDDFCLDISFSMKGSVISVFGPSGCGKTTLLNCIAGVLSPDSGTILFDNSIFFSSEKGISLKAEKRRAGMIFQDILLFPHLNVKKNILYGVKKTTDLKMFEKVVGLLGIEDILYKMPSDISRGQAQRAAIGRAVMVRPRFLLMDEPLSALDGANKNRLLKYIRLVNEKMNIPVIYVSHSIEEIEYLGSEIIMLENGKVIASGRPEDIISCGKKLPGTFLESHSALINGEIAIKNGNRFIKTHCGKELAVSDCSFEEGNFVSAAVKASDVTLCRGHLPDMSVANVYCGIVEQISVFGSDAIVSVDAGFKIYSKILTADIVKTGIEKGGKTHFFFSASAVKVYNSSQGEV